jgi:integrase
MAISKKKDSPYYYTRFSICGVRVQESTKCITKTEAQQYEDKRRNEIRQQVMLGKKPDRTWAEASLRWLDEKKHKKSLNGDIAHSEWLIPHLNHLCLSEITDELVEEITKKRLATKHGIKNKDGEIKNLKDTQPATVNRMLALIKGVLRAACYEWKWLDKMPRIKMQKEPKKRVRWITHEEAEQLIKELPPHLAIMARFSLATGLRETNVRELLWQDIDMKRRQAWIHHDQAKGEKAIPIPLNDDAMEILNKQLGNDEQYVFVYKGHPVGQCNTKAWRNALKRAKIKNFRWHDLRHTWASWHVQSGTRLQELQELGGWQSYDMVLRYAHLADSHLKEAANRISLVKSKSSGAKSVQKEK